MQPMWLEACGYPYRHGSPTPRMSWFVRYIVAFATPVGAGSASVALNATVPKRDRTASVVIRSHAFIQNLRRGHYELGMDACPGLTVAAAFDELALVV